MEERKVGARVRAARAGHSRFLGAERLPHAGRPLEGGAVRGPRADAARDKSTAQSQQEESLGEQCRLTPKRPSRAPPAPSRSYTRRKTLTPPPACSRPS